MAIDDKHPAYSKLHTDWVTMRDTYKGETAVKEKTTEYLPATSGMILDGMEVNGNGAKAYTAYITRAIFHSYVKDAVEAAIGVMHRKPADIQVPKALEPLLKKATLDGENLQQLLRRMNEEQLVTGRLGLLLDLPNTPTLSNVLPYIAFYQAEHVINWDAGKREETVVQNLNLVVLDESEFERQPGMNWEFVNKYRMLVLGDLEQNEGAGESATYRVGVFKKGEEPVVEKLVEPTIKGNTLTKIPFVFVNSKDILPTPDEPPLGGLAKLSLAIYRGEADYRQGLFMQSQDTLVVIGSTEQDKVRIGANASINVPIGGDAKFIGVNSQGLPEQRQALENDKNRASAMGGQLLDTKSRQKESGDALETRIAAQTATLNQIALTGAEALKQILMIAAEWVGADPNQVVVTPNLDFSDDDMDGTDLTSLMSAKMLGAPLSLETIHKLMKERGMTEMELEEELAKIAAEEPLVGGTDEGGDPDSKEQ